MRVTCLVPRPEKRGHTWITRLASPGSAKASCRSNPEELMRVPGTKQQKQLYGYQHHWYRTRSRNGSIRNKEYWKNLHMKNFREGSSEKKTEELFKQNRNHLRIIIGLRTGHYPVREHPNKIRLYKPDLISRQCGKEIECEALDHDSKQYMDNQN